MTPRERFLRALKREPIDRPCVGNPTSIATVDLMETTGCFFPDVHNDAAKMAELAATGYDLLHYDTIAPYFSVIQEAAALGANIDWGAKDRMPAVRAFPDGSYRYQEPEQITIPADFLDRSPTRTVLEAIGLLKARYGNTVAIVGKTFGPWTLAYHLFGLENFLILLHDNPEKLNRILEKLTAVSVLFGNAQIEAGADCLTIGDHLTGDLCRAETYRDYLLPFHKRLRSELPYPIVLHICGYTLDRLDYICHSGFDSFHFDSKNDAKEAVAIVAGRLALAGNVNNPVTLYEGKEEQIESEVEYALQAGVAVIGPECAVPLNTHSRYLRMIADVAQKRAGG